jgi:osmotically-inducible protein OsmY
MSIMNTTRLALGLLLAGCISAGQAPAVEAQQQPRKDFQIALDVLTEVTNYDQYGMFDDVTVNVRDGVTTLTGKVTLPNKRDEIEKRVKRIRGVSSVKNQIEVLPASKFDQELRVRIANTICNNSNFWGYCSLDKPPIHIIVEGNRVTLSGILNSDIDRKLAQSLAMQAGAGLVTNNLKTNAEARAAIEK